MPLTGLANAAIDRIAGGPASFAAGLARYGENDLLCYRAESPPDLVARQAASWDPLLEWARRRYAVHFEVNHGIIQERKSGGWGKGGSVRVGLVGRRIFKKKKK